MCKIQLFLFHYCLLLLLQQIEAKNDFELHFHNFTCSSPTKNNNPIDRFHCGLNKNLKRRNLNMEFTLMESLENFQFRLEISMPRGRVNFVLLNVTTDGCQFLANKNQVPLVRISREILDRYSNYPRECPFLRGKTYYIRAFRLDLGLIPAVNMETPAQLQFYYLHNDRQLLRGLILASVQRSTIAKKKPVLI